MKGTPSFPQDPGSVLTLDSSILNLCISAFLDLKRMEFPFQDIWNYTSHYDYNIVNPPKFFFSYVKLSFGSSQKIF